MQGGGLAGRWRSRQLVWLSTALLLWLEEMVVVVAILSGFVCMNTAGAFEIGG